MITQIAVMAQNIITIEHFTIRHFITGDTFDIN